MPYRWLLQVQVHPNATHVLRIPVPDSSPQCPCAQDQVSRTKTEFLKWILTLIVRFYYPKNFILYLSQFTHKYAYSLDPVRRERSM